MLRGTASLVGRTALITGGGKGIGRAIAEALAAEGAAVALSYAHDRASAEQAVAVIRSRGGAAAAYPLHADVWDEAVEVVRTVTAELGPLDILVNNAAVASPGMSVAEVAPHEAQRVLLVNTMSAFFMSKAVLPTMRTCGRGDIVMISSRATVERGPNRAPYAMSKAAVEELAISLALEERSHGIRVNTVAPGFVDTELGRKALLQRHGLDDLGSLEAHAPFGRFCSVDDVAQAVVYLVSPSGSYVTGQRIGVDGGGTSELFRSANRTGQ